MPDASLYNPPVPTRRETRPKTDAGAPLRLVVLTRHPEDATRIAQLLSDGAPPRPRCEAVTRMRDAVRRLRTGAFGAMLVESSTLLPGGLRVLERLCEFAGPVPVLLLLNDPAAPSPVDAIRRGAQDVLLRDELTPERLAAAVACGIERQRKMVELRDLSLTDPLTGLHNRRGFRTLAEANLRLMRRTQRQSLLLFADVDQLKRINDAQGHAGGDLALQLCAEALTQSLRESDIVARYGGDEYVALAVDVSDGASQVLLPRIAGTLFTLARHAGLPFTLEMSVGTATFGRGGQSLDEVLARADRALYAEKRRRGAANPIVAGQV